MKTVKIKIDNKYRAKEVYGDFYKCPECGNEYIYEGSPLSADRFNFCPNCGIKIEWIVPGFKNMKGIYDETKFDNCSLL